MGKETVKSLTRKGWSQKKIALKLHIRKTKVVSEQKRLKIGKRVVSAFWGDVKTVQRLEEWDWATARKATYNEPYWARKRAVRQGKEYKSYSEFWKEWRTKWRDSVEAEREKHTYEAVYGEEGFAVGGTVR